MTTTATSTVILSDLVLENIVTINQTSLIKNFKLITQCLHHFSDLQQKIVTLQKNNSNIIDQIQRTKRKQQKQMSEVRGTVKQLSITLQTQSNDYFTSNVRSSPTKDKQRQTYKTKDKDIKDKSNDQSTTSHKPTPSFLNKNSALVTKQIQDCQQRLRQQFKLQLFRLKQQQQQFYNPKKIQKQIQEIKDKLQLLSNTKIIDTKINTINQRISELSIEIKDSKSEQQKQLSYMQKSFEMVNKQFQSIEKRVDQFRSMQESIDDKIKLKADTSDLIKLQELLLSMLDAATNQMVRKLSDKQQTKKALVFLEKRINKAIALLVGEPGDQEKDALIATKGWKCVSCTKDLGQYEGKLDQFKPWAVFPTKSITKDKYHGFGLGFQEVIQKTIQKKGGEANYDSYGRMTGPINLTRQVNYGSNKSNTASNTKSRSNSQSFSKLKTPLPNDNSQPSSLQTNFMNNYGGNYEPVVNIVDQYRKRYKGISAYIIDSIKQGSK